MNDHIIKSIKCDLNDLLALSRPGGCSDYERDLRKWRGSWYASTPELREVKIALDVTLHNLNTPWWLR